MQQERCLARPRLHQARFDVLSGGRLLVVVALVVLFGGRKLAELTHHPLPPGLDEFTGLAIWWIYWGSVVGFGLVVMARWRNTYFRWRTVSAMVSQTLFGILLGGPLAPGLHVPDFARRLHLTWPLHMGVITPYAREHDPPAFVYGIIISLIAWPVITSFLGMRYCSWFCACGNLAETMGDVYRVRGPKGPARQSLDNMGYGVLALAAVATALLWVRVDGGFRWYDLVIAFLIADIIGIGAYPILGSRVWCRFFCPLRATLGWFSRRGRFAIYTSRQRCIECGTCNRYCEMGIDIRRRARQGIPLRDTECVACGACIAVCPRYALSFHPFPSAEEAVRARNARRFRVRFKRQLATPREGRG